MRASTTVLALNPENNEFPLIIIRSVNYNSCRLETLTTSNVYDFSDQIRLVILHCFLLHSIVCRTYRWVRGCCYTKCRYYVVILVQDRILKHICWFFQCIRSTLAAKLVANCMVACEIPIGSHTKYFAQNHTLLNLYWCWNTDEFLWD